VVLFRNNIASPFGKKLCWGNPRQQGGRVFCHFRADTRICQQFFVLWHTFWQKSVAGRENLLLLATIMNKQSDESI
jgi:hypothetical protein